MRIEETFLDSETAEFERLLADAVRRGIERLLQFALESEVEEHLTSKAPAAIGGSGIIRNGFMPARTLESAVGAILVRVPRLRCESSSQAFRSRVVRRYVRRLEQDASTLIDAYLAAFRHGGFGDLLRTMSGHMTGYIPSGIIKETDRRMARDVQRRARIPSTQVLVLTSRIAHPRIDLLSLRREPDGVFELHAVVAGEGHAFANCVAQGRAASSEVAAPLAR